MDGEGFALLSVVDGGQGATAELREDLQPRSTDPPTLELGCGQRVGDTSGFSAHTFLVDLRDADVRQLCLSTLSRLSWTDSEGGSLPLLTPLKVCQAFAQKPQQEGRGGA